MPSVGAKEIYQARVLTERDRKILIFTGQGGIATLTQLHQKFWEQAKERTAYERLGELVRAGYLGSQTVHIRKSGERVYTLTPKGVRQFSVPEREGLMVGLPAHHELKQQLIAQDIRLLVEKEFEQRGMKLLEWQNERQLRSEQRHQLEQAKRARGWGKVIAGAVEDIPDARVMIVNAEGETGELDIEIDGQYSKQMLVDKISSFARTARPTLWVTSPGRLERIRDEVEKARAGKI